MESYELSKFKCVNCGSRRIKLIWELDEKHILGMECFECFLRSTYDPSADKFILDPPFGKKDKNSQK